MIGLCSTESGPLHLMLIPLSSQVYAMVSVSTIPTALSVALQTLREIWGFYVGKRNGTRLLIPVGPLTPSTSLR